jgi:hypothetical protein
MVIINYKKYILFIVSITFKNVKMKILEFLVFLLGIPIKAFKSGNKCLPEWAYLKIPQIDLQDMIYYCSKTQKKAKRFKRGGPRTTKNI